MATPKNQATILLNIFDGTRQPIGPGVKNLLVRIIDGNQKQLSRSYCTTLRKTIMKQAI